MTSQPLVHLQMHLWLIVSAVNDEDGFLRLCVPDSERDDGEPGNGIAQWRLNEQLFPCPVCGKVFGRQQTLSRHLSLHTGKYTHIHNDIVTVCAHHCATLVC